MKIGIPRERKTLEKRVGLTPEGAEHLTKLGSQVIIEKDAGVGSGFNDEDYAQRGARVVGTLKEVWTEAELIVKVKEPHELEYEFFRPGLTLFDYLHLAGLPDVTKALVDSGITSVAYELVQTEEGRLPLLEPMSEIAGKLSVLNGSYQLLTQNGGRGILLGGAVGAARAGVTIIGAGIAGKAACQVAFGMGAQVTILDINQSKLKEITKQFGNQITTAVSTPESITRILKKTDLLIGAVLVPGAAAPKIVTREMIKEMPTGSVLVDISIDQGGCAETIRPTSLKEPTFVEEDVIHYGVTNMPSQTARTSTIALTSSTLPYIGQLASEGDPLESLRKYPELTPALNTHKGKLTNEAISVSVGIPYTPISEALGG